ncbi:MAG: YgjV family protein [Stomatobaculum sp.]|nr:YgjV family protein [Stomatobaculum sp.]
MFSIIAQAVGFIGTGVVILSYQCKSTRRMIFVLAVSALLFAIHYYMLGGLGGALSQILYAVNMFLLNDRKHAISSWIGWRWTITAILIVMTVMTWAGLPSLLPCLSSIANTHANWSRSGKIIRLNRLLFASPCWILYDIIMGSVSGIICEAFAMSSILISIMRYGIMALDV